MINIDKIEVFNEGAFRGFAQPNEESWEKSDSWEYENVRRT